MLRLVKKRRNEQMITKRERERERGINKGLFNKNLSFIALQV